MGRRGAMTAGGGGGGSHRDEIAQSPSPRHMAQRSGGRGRGPWPWPFSGATLCLSGAAPLAQEEGHPAVWLLCEVTYDCIKSSYSKRLFKRPQGRPFTVPCPYPEAHGRGQWVPQLRPEPQPQHTALRSLCCAGSVWGDSACGLGPPQISRPAWWPTLSFEGCSEPALQHWELVTGKKRTG